MPFSVSLPCPLTPPPDPFQIHEEFKELVDALLTDFITELGVSGETFYEVVAAENSGGDKLNRCVGEEGGDKLNRCVGEEGGDKFNRWGALIMQWRVVCGGGGEGSGCVPRTFHHQGGQKQSRQCWQHNDKQLIRSGGYRPSDPEVTEVTDSSRWIMYSHVPPAAALWYRRS